MKSEANCENRIQAIEEAVRAAVHAMGLERIRGGEFFGMKQPRPAAQA